MPLWVDGFPNLIRWLETFENMPGFNHRGDPINCFATSDNDNFSINEASLNSRFKGNQDQYKQR